MYPGRVCADTVVIKGGAVTNSQLFKFNGGSGPLSFQPENDVGSCFTVKGNALDAAQCSSGDANQSFTFGAAAAGGKGNDTGVADGKTTSASNASQTGAGTTSAPSTTAPAKETEASKDTAVATTASTSCTQRTRTVTASAVNNVSTGNQEATSAPSTSETEETASATEQTASATETASSAIEDPASSGSGPGSAGQTTDAGTAKANPTTPVPVSRAGGTLNPTAAAESQQRDGSATRAFSEVEIRAPNGQCLSVDPTAGDFRQNLIPVGLVDCAGTANEKWDVITAGKHNNAKDSAIIVSSLVRITYGLFSMDMC